MPAERDFATTVRAADAAIHPDDGLGLRTRFPDTPTACPWSPSSSIASPLP
ncbi:hypothetical protein OG874_09830 [Nocardia sp. NBC_00565]|uniref:hypothetical protein n=1 Tax=Nocardia sp. NBC_00565 TaxID=2975993 RepID=UPI002E80F99B|nr:hypothetical protein [Nocardia sp. NBC_00565]WUC05411.1 hypothetical protein OG874_09830 [Nocardia sp. NBC_00565]